MIIGRNVALALLALAVVVTLGLQSRMRVGEEDARMADGARRLRELDTTLDRSVLEAADGLIQSYDILSATLEEMDRVENEIGVLASTIQDPVLSASLARARKVTREQAVLVERFETRNAVLRNSLAYLPRGATAAIELRGTGEDETIAREVTLLLASVLLCRNHCDPAAADDIRARIALLTSTRNRANPSARATVDRVLQHARLVAIHAPPLESSIESLTLADDRAYDELYTTVQNRRAHAIVVANGFRTALVVLSLLLLAAVVATVRSLRQKQATLADLNEHLEARVTERTHDLNVSREQYRVLLESTRAIPWEMEPGKLRFSYVGPQAARVVGHPAETWLEDGFLERVVHSEDLQATLVAFEDAKEDHEIELRMIARGGKQLWLRTFVASVSDPEGRLVRRGIFVDVTARRTLEAKLGMAQKMESIGRLAAGVAHEINTPVQFVGDNIHFTTSAFTTIGGLLKRYEALLRSTTMAQEERIAAAEEAAEMADAAYLLEEGPRALLGSAEGLERIATIVRSLNDFSKADPERKSPADLNSSLQSTLNVARNEYCDVADVELDLGELPPVRCNIGEINQVILNLTVNAAQAIAAANPNGSRGRISVRTWQDGSDVVMSVKDTGIGIPEQIRARVFDPFFTTKDVGNGTGQGLAISRRIVVERHGGDLTFESVAAVGTTFFLRLPIDPPDLSSSAIPAV